MYWVHSKASYIGDTVIIARVYSEIHCLANLNFSWKHLQGNSYSNVYVSEFCAYPEICVVALYFRVGISWKLGLTWLGINVKLFYSYSILYKIVSLEVSILKRSVNVEVEGIGMDLYAEGKLVIYFIQSSVFARTNFFIYCTLICGWLQLTMLVFCRLMCNTWKGKQNGRNLFTHLIRFNFIPG